MTRPALFAFGAVRWPGTAKLNEEIGELAQVIGRLMNTQGDPSHWDGSDLRRGFEDEIADVHAAIGFIIEHCEVDVTRIGARSAMKRGLFEKWHRERIAGADEPPPLPPPPALSEPT